MLACSDATKLTQFHSMLIDGRWSTPERTAVVEYLDSMIRARALKGKNNTKLKYAVYGNKRQVLIDALETIGYTIVWNHDSVEFEISWPTQ